MKVLFQITLGHKLSRVQEQVYQLKANLEELDAKVSISSLSNINLKDFDIVHIFNCIKVTDSYNYYMNAVNQKKRIALTPFFIDMHEHYSNNPEKLAEWRVDNLLRREIMQGSHMLLLNSQKELSDIQRILYVDVPAKVIFHDWGNRKMEALMAKATFEAYQQVLDSNDSPEGKGKFLYTQVYTLPTNSLHSNSS